MAGWRPTGRDLALFAALTVYGLFSAPATKLVVLLNTPATQLARVVKAKAEKS